MAKSNIYVFTYNNYFNRIIRKHDNLSDYGTPAYTLIDTNFDYADGVTTQHVFNYDGKGDYLIVTDSENNIKHRWFIIDDEKVRGGQHKYNLKRDLLADKPHMYGNTIFSVERGTVPDYDPRIFNPEGFTYNQIKKAEYKIFDRTSCPWIVGYFATTYNSEGYQQVEDPSTFDIDMGSTSFSGWTYYNNIGTNNYGPATVSEIDILAGYSYYSGGTQMATGGRFKDTPTGSSYDLYSNLLYHNRWSIEFSNMGTYLTAQNTNRKNWYNWDTINTYANQLHVPTLNAADITTLTSYNGKKLKFTDGVYKISFEGVDEITTYTNENDITDNSLTNYINDQIVSNATGASKRPGLYGKRIDKYSVIRKNYTLSFTQESVKAGIQYEIPSSAPILTDAPYKMFAIPYPVLDNYNITIGSVRQYANIGMEVAKDILNNSTKTQVYDVQLLPFCPIEFSAYSYSSNSTTLTIPSNLTEGTDYTLIKDLNTSPNIIGYMFFPKESSFKFTLDTVFNGTTRTRLLDIPYFNNNLGDEVKIKSETQFVRFCDPSFNAGFEMKPVTNNGIQSINVYCTYKPYNPYMLVAPDFNRMYGRTYDDSRGLLLQGDYSLPDTDSAWQQYELNNKTYQQSFNREITHMEREYSIQKQEALWGMASGAVSGAAMGALAGSKIGGPGIGTGVGAALGSATSLIGGIMDYANLGKRQAEEIDYRKDMFNFQLQNIKALPNTLNKTSSIVANSKYVPYIECYDCTDEEKDVLRKYIRYNGMNFGGCGTITQSIYYWPSGYYKASIIRTEEQLSPQELDAFNQEIMKGAYFE